jgi:hypothetical protein
MSGNPKAPPLPPRDVLTEDPETVNRLYKSNGISKRFPIAKFAFDAETNEPRPMYILFEHGGKPRPGSQARHVKTRVYDSILF